MYRLIVAMSVLLTVAVLPFHSGAAAADGGTKPLLELDGMNYSTSDYEHWWEIWRNDPSQVPDRVESFIDWLLMAREAEEMELDTVPAVRHKIDVFLKARNLLILKNDEVDAHIVISESDIQNWYKKHYIPMLMISVISFDSKLSAEAAYDNFIKTGATLERIRQQSESEGLTVTIKHPQWLRPNNTPVSWLPYVQGLEASAFSRPLSIGERFAILYIVDRKEYDEDDLSHKKKAIKNEIRKQLEQQLTQKLLKALKNKYNVQVDEQLLAEIDLISPDPEHLNKILVSSTKSEVTVGYFLNMCRKEQNITKKQFGDKEQQSRIKRRIVRAMITNSLVAWEAAERHYEEIPPFKWVYQFYRQHRMIKELEQRISADITISEQEIEQYYNGHKDDFSRPGAVRLGLAAGAQGDINKLWGKVVGGSDFTKAVGTQPGLSLIRERLDSVPTSTLPQSVQKVVADLDVGEISRPFAYQGRMGLLELFEREESGLYPLSTVKDKISATMNQIKREDIKKRYVEMLRSRSVIKVDSAGWLQIQKKYEQKEM